MPKVTTNCGGCKYAIEVKNSKEYTNHGVLIYCGNGDCESHYGKLHEKLDKCSKGVPKVKFTFKQYVGTAA